MMKTVEPIETEKRHVNPTEVIQLPFGILGFEQVKRYILLAKAGEEPFMWLQMTAGPKRSFVVLSTRKVLPDYQPDISASDVEFLGLTCPEDALVLNIVTLNGTGQATVNLKGPIVINRHTLIGRQVIPENASQYSLRHPLPVC
jgi:flagellar assembly factor FliW